MSGFLGSVLGALLFWRASRLYRKDRLPEALVILERIPRLVEPATSAPRLSAKLSALKLHSLVAARQGDVALARAALAQGLPLWQETKLGNPMAGGLGAMDEWERWGRTYLVQLRVPRRERGHLPLELHRGVPARSGRLADHPDARVLHGPGAGRLRLLPGPAWGR